MTDVAPGLRVTLLGMAASGALATIKLVAGLIGHSYALVADAVESFSDIAGSAIVWGGLAVSAKPPDENHPYGHGKAEPLAALAVGVMLLGASVGITVEAVNAVVAPPAPPAPFTLIVLGGVVLVKEAMYRLASRVGRQINSTAIHTDAWHHRSDALTSLLAAVGISLALVGGERFAIADGCAAVLAAFIIAFNGGRFVHAATHELMDTQPPDEVLSAINDAALSVPGVAAVEKIMARKVGVSYLADMHVEVDGALSVRAGHHLAHQVKDAVLAHEPRVADVLVHVEPHECAACHHEQPA